MSLDFHLLDLPSQGVAVQRLLAGRPAEEKIAWLAAHGKLSEMPCARLGERPIYRFVSTIGMESLFFLDHDTIVFIGDNTTYTVKEHLS